MWLAGLFLVTFYGFSSLFCWRYECNVSYDGSREVSPYFSVMVVDTQDRHFEAVPYSELDKYLKEHPNASVHLESDFGVSEDQFWEFNVTYRDQGVERIEVSFLDDAGIDEVYDVMEGVVKPISFRLANEAHVFASLVCASVVVVIAYFFIKRRRKRFRS